MSHEAGMAGTRDLAAVVRHVDDAGGSVRLVGDDRQLAAVAAGGILGDLVEQGYAHGTTATLTELHRFTDPVEGSATLGIRDGDPAALNHYLDCGRVHTGDIGDVSPRVQWTSALWPLPCATSPSVRPRRRRMPPVGASGPASKS